MNSRDKIRNLKWKKIQGTVLKGAFVTCEVSNNSFFYTKTKVYLIKSYGFSYQA